MTENMERWTHLAPGPPVAEEDQGGPGGQPAGLDVAPRVWLIGLGILVFLSMWHYVTCRGLILWLNLTAAGVCLAGFMFAYLRSRQRSRLAMLVVLAAGVGGAIWIGSSPFHRIETFGWGDAPFDSVAWRSDAAPRAPMVRDLLRTGLLAGRTREEVLGLLGEPDGLFAIERIAGVEYYRWGRAARDNRAKSEQRWSYTFGDSLFGGGELALWLGEDGRVSSVIITSDD